MFKYDNTVLHCAAKMKQNWSCPTCGMYSSRRYSVQRHIDNKHSTGVTPIPFVEYIAGLKDGKYHPGARPGFGGTNDNLLAMMAKELERIRTQRVIDMCLPPVGHSSYAEEASILKTYVSRLATIDRLNLLRDSIESKNPS